MGQWRAQGCKHLFDLNGFALLLLLHLLILLCSSIFASDKSRMIICSLNQSNQSAKIVATLVINIILLLPLRRAHTPTGCKASTHPYTHTHIQTHEHIYIVRGQAVTLSAKWKCWNEVIKLNSIKRIFFCWWAQTHISSWSSPTSPLFTPLFAPFFSPPSVSLSPFSLASSPLLPLLSVCILALKTN